MKVILDTNVIIAAFASRGLCSSVFELCLDRHTTIISEHILSEIKKNLQKKIKMPTFRCELIIEYLREYCPVSEIDELENNICRDKNDIKILGLAKHTKPEFIITGDKDLLVLKEFYSIKIITPREFWNISKEENQK